MLSAHSKRLAGTALFLLMTFRTNSCYDRWYEGRKIWGAMGIHCLDVARVARGWLAKRDPQLAARILRLLVAYSTVFKYQLRGEVEVCGRR
jgi:putative membrane protein